MNRGPRRLDGDAQLVRRTAWRVGAWITGAAVVLVVGVLVAAVFIVLQQIPLRDLLDLRHHEETVDVGGWDVLAGVLVIGALAVALAAALSLVATRHAVVPLVDALARQRHFVADASHELRTPLAILDARLQALERSLTADDPHREVVDELRGDARALIAVVDDLLASLEVAEGDHDGMVPVAPVVAGVVSSMQVLGADRGVRIVAEPINEGVLVVAVETSLQRALTALVENAVKHSDRGGIVELSVRTTRRDVRLTVRDHGRGIRGIDPARVFDRFARSSAASGGGGDGESGFGIGLSLVQDTAARFGGRVEVTDSSAAGTAITLTLPRALAS